MTSHQWRWPIAAGLAIATVLGLFQVLYLFIDNDAEPIFLASAVEVILAEPVESDSASEPEQQLQAEPELQPLSLTLADSGIDMQLEEIELSADNLSWLQ